MEFILSDTEPSESAMSFGTYVTPIVLGKRINAAKKKLYSKSFENVKMLLIVTTRKVVS